MYTPCILHTQIRGDCYAITIQQYIMIVPGSLPREQLQPIQVLTSKHINLRYDVFIGPLVLQRVVTPGPGWQRPCMTLLLSQPLKMLQRSTRIYIDCICYAPGPDTYIAGNQTQLNCRRLEHTQPQSSSWVQNTCGCKSISSEEGEHTASNWYMWNIQGTNEGSGFK
jgi:hypothetical protein